MIMSNNDISIVMVCGVVFALALVGWVVGGLL